MQTCTWRRLSHKGAICDIQLIRLDKIKLMLLCSEEGNHYSLNLYESLPLPFFFPKCCCSVSTNRHEWMVNWYNLSKCFGLLHYSFAETYTIASFMAITHGIFYSHQTVLLIFELHFEALCSLPYKRHNNKFVLFVCNAKKVWILLIWIRVRCRSSLRKKKNSCLTNKLISHNMAWWASQ